MVSLSVFLLLGLVAVDRGGGTARALKLDSAASSSTTSLPSALKHAGHRNHRPDLVLEASFLAAALSEAQSHVFTAEVKKGSSLDFKSFLFSKDRDSVLRRLQAAIDRWTEHEDRLRDWVLHRRDSYHEVQTFDDSIINLANSKALLGHVYWRSQQDHIAVQLLEGACPLLFEYRAAARSPDSYSWLDCYISLRDLHSRLGIGEPSDLDTSFQARFPWIASAIQSTGPSFSSSLSISSRLRPRSVLVELGQFSRSDRAVMSLETRRGWAVADDMRSQMSALLVDFVTCPPGQRPAVIARARAVVTAVETGFRSGNTQFDRDSGSSPRDREESEPQDALTTLFTEFRQLRGERGEGPSLQVHRLREALLAEVLREGGVYLAVLDLWADPSAELSVEGAREASREGGGVPPLGFQSFSEVLQVLEYCLVQVQGPPRPQLQDQPEEEASPSRPEGGAALGAGLALLLCGATLLRSRGRDKGAGRRKRAPLWPWPLSSTPAPLPRHSLALEKAPAPLKKNKKASQSTKSRPSSTKGPSPAPLPKKAAPVIEETPLLTVEEEGGGSEDWIPAPLERKKRSGKKVSAPLPCERGVSPPPLVKESPPDDLSLTDSESSGGGPSPSFDDPPPMMLFCPPPFYSGPFYPPPPYGYFAAPSPPPLLAVLQAQIEYYFSEENLGRDLYLRSLMDGGGFVRLAEIARFRRVQRLGASAAQVLGAVRASERLEASECWAVRAAPSLLQLSSEVILESRVRTVFRPLHWVLAPLSHQSPSS